ncbi:MAG: hypothetical protein QM766_00250 [Burkholderiaceae bacterium]
MKILPRSPVGAPASMGQLMNAHVPPQVLEPYNLAAQRPDDFIVELLDLHPATVLEAAANHRRSLKNPPQTADEYLDTLLTQGLTQSVARMRQWIVAM